MEVARPHHGSMSREQRTLVEEALKSGRLPSIQSPTWSKVAEIVSGSVGFQSIWRLPLCRGRRSNSSPVVASTACVKV